MLIILYIWPNLLFLKYEGIIEKISYERRVYVSVDDRNLSYDIYIS